MKQGDIIGGYRIVSEPTNNGGGKCIWAFAEKGGREYFIKRFLEPKRPGERSTASEASKRLILEECEEFEDRHRTIMNRLKPDASGAGNLVLAVDFFHERSTYYKITERIDTSSLDKPQALAPRQKAVLLKTLGLSLRLLHEIGVVHGDIKPANVLVQKRTTANAFYTTKLIDFDDSYISGQPPERGVIVGDSLFGAPEWRRYLQGDRDVKPEYLTTNTDVFALGLMSHYYLTGAIPGYSASFGSPADAVNAGAVLRLDDRLTSDMQKLVLAMTSRAPGARPKIAAFLEALVNPEICALHRKTRAPGRTPKGKANGRSGTAAETTPTSRLRTNLGSVPTASHRTTASAHPATADERAAPSAPGSVSDDTAASEPIFGSAARRKSRVHINLDGYPT